MFYISFLYMRYHIIVIFCLIFVVVVDTIDENNELPIIRRSSYYDFDKFNSLAQTNDKQFSILSSNIQSINAKFSELEAFVNDLSSLNFVFSIICLQESWLSENYDL